MIAECHFPGIMAAVKAFGAVGAVVAKDVSVGKAEMGVLIRIAREVPTA